MLNVENYLFIMEGFLLYGLKNKVKLPYALDILLDSDITKHTTIFDRNSYIENYTKYTLSQ